MIFNVYKSLLSDKKKKNKNVIKPKLLENKFFFYFLVIPPSQNPHLPLQLEIFFFRPFLQGSYT